MNMKQQQGALLPVSALLAMVDVKEKDLAEEVVGSGVVLSSAAKQSDKVLK